MKKKANKGTAKLKQIIAKAKTIRKAHPGIKWQNCVKQAAKKI